MRPASTALAFAALALASTPALADTTIRVVIMAYVSPGTSGPEPETQFVIRIKGLESRTDFESNGTDISFLQSVTAGQLLMINHATRRIRDAMPPEVEELPSYISNAKLSVKPSGRTKAILGRACVGYTYRATLKTGRMTWTQTGVIWMAKDGGDLAEWRAFSNAVRAAGLPNPPFAGGLQGRAVAEIQRRYVPNGIPLEMQMQRKASSVATRVLSISTDPIPDEVFVVPAGYARQVPRTAEARRQEAP